MQVRKLPLIIDPIPEDESPEDAASRVLAEDFGQEKDGRDFAKTVLMGYAYGLGTVEALAKEFPEDELSARVHLAGMAYWLGVTAQKKDSTKWVRGHLDLYFGGPRGFRDTKQWVRFFEDSYEVGRQERLRYAGRLEGDSLEVVSFLLAEEVHGGGRGRGLDGSLRRLARRVMSA